MSNENTPPIVLDYGHRERRRVDWIRWLARLLMLLVILPIGILLFYLASSDPAASTGDRLFVIALGSFFLVCGIWFLHWSFAQSRKERLVHPPETESANQLH